MEKRKPHYTLSRLKQLVEEGNYQVTRIALSCAKIDFGLKDSDAIGKHVLDLSPGEFYKSMTCYGNPRIWQDVYHHDVNGRLAYLKVQIDNDESVVISFKKLENW